MCNGEHNYLHVPSATRSGIKSRSQNSDCLDDWSVGGTLPSQWHNHVYLHVDQGPNPGPLPACVKEPRNRRGSTTGRSGNHARTMEMHVSCYFYSAWNGGPLDGFVGGSRLWLASTSDGWAGPCTQWKLIIYHYSGWGRYSATLNGCVGRSQIRLASTIDQLAWRCPHNGYH